MENRYIANKTRKKIPPVKSRRPPYASSVKTVVTKNSAPAYIFELRSKTTTGSGKRRSPRAKAHRMLEMEDPTTVPRPMEARFCKIDATTTASWTS
jgi:hypothetical protein